jgi:hypothetical protein
MVFRVVLGSKSDVGIPSLQSSANPSAQGRGSPPHAFSPQSHRVVGRAVHPSSSSKDHHGTADEAYSTALPVSLKRAWRQPDFVKTQCRPWRLRNVRRLGIDPTGILDFGACEGQWTSMARPLIPDASPLHDRGAGGHAAESRRGGLHFGYLPHLVPIVFSSRPALPTLNSIA